MSGRGGDRTASRLRRHLGVLLVALGFAVFIIAVFLSGLGVAAMLSRATNATTWTVWGNVGQTFESINAVFSGLAFTAIVVTFWFQLKELREQRLELQLQRDAANGSRDALRRSADVDLRRLHLQIMKMSLDDPLLAAVWPAVQPDLPDARAKQYMYINLLFQHAHLALDLSRYDEETVRTFLRYLFSSELVREYWQASRHARDASTLDPREVAFFQLAEEVYRQYPPGGPAAQNSPFG